MKPTEPTTAAEPLVLQRATLLIRTLLTQCTTPDEIAEALADANLLNPTVRPAHEAAAGTVEQLVVWRAEIDTIPLDTYLTREDAQAHCEADHRQHRGADHPLIWCENAAHGGADMWIGHDHRTDYAVIPVPVLAAYADGAE